MPTHPNAIAVQRVPRSTGWTAGLVACALIGAWDTAIAQDFGKPSVSAGPGVRDYTIDGIRGPVSTEQRYGQNDQVRVVITNVNPFLYEYQISVSSTKYSEPSVGDFFTALFGLKLPSPPAGGGPGQEHTINPLLWDGTVVSKLSPGCPATTKPDVVNRATNRVAALLRQGDYFTDARGQATGSVDSIQGMYKRVDQGARDRLRIMLDPKQDAQAVHEAAAPIVAALDTFQRATNGPALELPGQLAALWRLLGALRTDRESAAKEFPDCRRFELLKAELASFAGDSAAIESVVKATIELRGQLNTVHDRLALIDRPDSYFMIKVLDRQSGPTDIMVSVERKAAAQFSLSPPGKPAGEQQAFHTFATVRLNFGGQPRFHLGAGFAWGDVPFSDFGTMKQFVTAPLGNPGDTVGVFVREKEHSEHRIIPILTFGIRLLPISRGTAVGDLYFMTAAGIKPDDKLTNVQYFGGLGASLFNGRMILMAGGMAAPSSELSGGLRLGTRVPGGSDQTITRKVMKYGVAFGVTFKIL